jgi:hypothetical protein
MFVVSLSAGLIAGSVWANAGRTLTADPATDAGAATLVWTHASRQPTSLTLAIGGGGAQSSAVGTGVVLDLRPAAGASREVMAQADGNFSFGVYNGATFVGFTAATQLFYSGPSHNSFGYSIKNTNAGSQNATYCYTQLS